MAVNSEDIKVYLPESWTGVPCEELEEAYAEFSRVFPHGECSPVTHYWKTDGDWYKRIDDETWRFDGEQWFEC